MDGRRIFFAGRLRGGVLRRRCGMGESRSAPVGEFRSVPKRCARRTWTGGRAYLVVGRGEDHKMLCVRSEALRAILRSVAPGAQRFGNG